MLCKSTCRSSMEDSKVIGDFMRFLKKDHEPYITLTKFSRCP